MKYIKPLKKSVNRTDDEIEKELATSIESSQELGFKTFDVGEYSPVFLDFYNFIFRHRAELSALGYDVKFSKSSSGEHIATLHLE
ncbi:hypothetical protein RND61_14755 [Streptomyces sp. TRM76323]|uniref:Uncharacterized protein n=1 Tax=Streptomyces tamarix TaxID=3078565 RepID=A0ABU3QLJ9_9ACTN|nr:hypothetical protein [Streptomyces tamarix]MDT9683323.1 hypothetical protein [Streptomyces tamarix]